LGTGAFGSVYRGCVNGISNKVAIKTTQPSCSITTLKSLLSEIKVLSHLGQHDNIVCLIGACTQELKQGKNFKSFYNLRGTSPVANNLKLNL